MSAAPAPIATPVVTDPAGPPAGPPAPVRPRHRTPPRHRRRARRRPHFAPAWAWPLLLVAALAGVLIGALEEGGGVHATAAQPAPALIEDGPWDAEEPMRIPVRVAHSERSGPIVDLRDRSLALGHPNGGRLRDAVRLPVRGAGYYTYNPATQRPPGGADRRWGTAMLVSQVIEVGEWWARTYPGAPRLGIGDLSRPDGGPFHGPVVGHSSHQNGLDVDIRLPRRDGVEGPANPSNYDRELTQRLVDRLAAQGATVILVGPNLDLRGPVTVWPNHDDHLHVRFADPDGTGN